MNKLLEKKFCGAMTKTLRAYEYLISDVEKYKSKWIGVYGNVHCCKVCAVFQSKGLGHKCEYCPLYSLDDFGCGCRSIVMFFLKTALYSDCNENIKRAATARYLELIKHLKKVGYEYK